MLVFFARMQVTPCSTGKPQWLYSGFSVAFGGQVECLRLLLASPLIDINQAQDNGSTPLSLAAYCGHVECVRLLLASKSIDVNQARDNGYNPLLLATLEATSSA